jgi:hypothetical protein
MPLIENASSVEVHAVIQFLNAKQQSPTEIHQKRVGMLIQGVKLLHDNAIPHTAGKNM